jgi:hypothetical protein
VFVQPFPIQFLSRCSEYKSHARRKVGTGDTKKAASGRTICKRIIMLIDTSCCGVVKIFDMTQEIDCVASYAQGKVKLRGPTYLFFELINLMILSAS